jgi:hypothetical protein
MASSGCCWTNAESRYTCSSPANELADERGLSVLAEEIQRRAPQRLKEFGQWEGRMDRVMWAHLKMSEAFEEAAMFARADALAAGRFWVKRNSLPAGKISVDGKVRRTFENALSEHYWPTESRPAAEPALGPRRSLPPKTCPPGRFSD